ncbi:epimerase [Paenibacillus sp. MY03]|uniref:NAD-dependent epimerase/dehydratase family protein n=1 Tax=Paenibacillus sp. MY03 TaxID=302980 RepID=UPI000B3C768F|nr:NAD-dependent epimerase/dehydratase [Paenibacillus sp. MY03]OUS75138.1 epimerase [Paenibacillus sp. MY03]
MKKALVTGANGFLGAALINELLKQNVSVIAAGREGRDDHIPNHEKVRFVSFDISRICDLKDKIADTDIDVFYHLAWAGSAGPSRADTALQLQNAQWTVDSVRVAKEMGCKRFVGAGSIMEKETTTVAFSQGSEPGMGYIYGGGKLIAHCMSKSVAAQLGIDHLWAVITNAFGEGEISPRFINTTLRNIMNDKPLQFTVGTQNYDFVHVADVARALYLIGDNGKTNHEYVIGSSNARPLREFILEMKEQLAPEKEFQFGDVPFTGVNLPMEVFNCSETERDTGFRAEISFSEGIVRTMKWVQREDQ